MGSALSLFVTPLLAALLGAAAPSPALAAAANDAERLSVEAERQALENERAALATEKERLELAKERIALDKQKRELADARAHPAKVAGEPEPLSGGLDLSFAWRDPLLLRNFDEHSAMPFEFGMAARLVGIVWEVAYLYGEGREKGPVILDYQVRAMGFGMGYDVEPWHPLPGQVRLYLPLGLRISRVEVSVDDKNYIGSTLAARLGLGARWRLSRHWGLDLSGRWHSNLSGGTFKNDNGNHFLMPDGTQPLTGMDGLELRLASNFYLW